MLERTLCIRTALRAVHGSYSTQIELMQHVQSDCAQSVHDSCSHATAEVGSGPAECLMSNADYRVKSSFAHSMLTLDAWGPARTVSWRASHGGRRIGLCGRVPHAYAIRYGVCTSGCVLLVCKVHSPFSTCPCSARALTPDARSDPGVRTLTAGRAHAVRR